MSSGTCLIYLIPQGTSYVSLGMGLKTIWWFRKCKIKQQQRVMVEVRADWNLYRTKKPAASACDMEK